ncbi:MAG TPA: hypothetical protein VFG68_11035 [Fimbriiglobus sp.]|nr:hypothetical protein [Fimbriiglobus sp.]
MSARTSNLPLWQRPWRSATAGWAVAAAVLAAGVPLFLCMPPWTDVTLYDVAARTVLRGGVHYRDVFDTNTPGFVWALAAIRSCCGWSSEALRAWDLAVVAATTALLIALVRRAGGAGYPAAWFAAAVALFYPFTSEFCHCQRDVWMLLPAAAAAWLRLRRVGSSPNPPAPFPKREGGERANPLPVSPSRFGEGPREGLAWAVVEGLLWGMAVWLKPHVIVPAFAVWLVSAVSIYRAAGWRRALADALGLLVSGLLAGGLGVLWLVRSGAWPYFVDVFTNWNPEYVAQTWVELPDRPLRTFEYFPPWSLLHLAAVPLAVAGLRGTRPARAVLGALYLGWLLQALVLQKGLDYVHVPETLLAMAVLAGHRWAVGFPFLVWFAVTGVALNLTGTGPAVASFNRWIPAVRLERHPLADPAVLAVWPRCWREGSTPELRDRLGQYVDVHCGTRWEDLDRVARFLRTVEPPLGDRELTCWHDSTHPLYLMLGVEPSTRYMHFGTVFSLRGKVDVIRAEVAASRQRYVVSDLRRMTYRLADAYAPGAHGEHSLPGWFPRSQRGVFPWNQPVVFRSGRYVVHRVEEPIGEIDIPAWEKLDELGPGGE